MRLRLYRCVRCQAEMRHSVRLKPALTEIDAQLRLTQDDDFMTYQSIPEISLPS